VALRLREIAAAWPATPVEDEALSLAAQLLASMDMLEDALAVYRRVQDRTPSEGGAVAYARFVCEVAPRAFDELRSRGQLLRALGLYRGYLEKPEAHACVDPRMRMDAASTAVAAGLPMLAQRWVGQAVVTGTGTREDSENVLVLASLYRREGRLDLAERTLDWLEDGEMPLPEPELLAERGSVAMLRGEAAEAERAYRLAMERAATTVRGRAALPGLRWRRALALEKLGAGRGREALAELRGALAEGGAAAEDGGGGEGAGWERAAALGAQLASDAASWEAVLADVGRAEEARGEERPRSLRWRRAEALFALGRRVEAEPILDELAATPDAWGLLARSARARADFEARLDEVVAERERD
jgi:tetratricopeptide (TPR) repeat protein